MPARTGFEARAKVLLSILAICAFLSVFASIDTAEYYRAWSHAKNWTGEQKSVAPAEDARRMHILILVALALDTAVIAVAACGGLTLGMATATESPAAAKTALALGIASPVLGLAYSADMLVYRIGLGSRHVLKGPIFDYHMRLQPPVILAMAAFPVIVACLPFFIHNRKFTARRSGE